MKRLLMILMISLLLSACASSGTANRSTGNQLDPVPFTEEPRKVDVDEYLEFLDSLAVAIGEGVPRELTLREREQFRDTDSELRDMLEGVTNVDELSDEAQIEVFNLHERLQGIVIGDPENYL
ncbi:MAG: hypothetical protein AAGJ52_04995, partial [Pseudomonadota bacterium]